MAQKVLLIEDDRFISELYVRSLKKAGYDVTATISGPEGYEMAKTGRYDIVLLDIMIPDLTGVEILEQLRGTDKSLLPNTKIIIATNLDQDEESRARMEELADGYFIKADITPNRLIDFLSKFGDQNR